MKPGAIQTTFLERSQHCKVSKAQSVAFEKDNSFGEYLKAPEVSWPQESLLNVLRCAANWKVQLLRFIGKTMKRWLTLYLGMLGGCV